MTDDNQKFLEKFKSQITTMGKNGILDSDNNNIILSTPNINNNKQRKGSAFLKPIKTKKINNNKKESTINNIITNKDNIINYPLNNPYINEQIHQQQKLPISSLLYYQYNNPYMYYNYNQNDIQNFQGIYPPYQFYYYPNQNYPYIINNQLNIIPQNNSNLENNKIENKINKNVKKKLRPISAQNIVRTNNNRSYLINNNNITNLTLNNKSNPSRYEYKPYTLKDYKEIINIDTLGGLGANIGTEEWEKKKEKMEKMSEYSKNIFNKVKNIKNKNGNLKIKKKEEISTRKRANEYGKLIRPKSSGHINIVKKHNDNKKIILKNEVNKKNKGEIKNNKEKEKEKLKEIFDENDDDKEMMEYYNKFKINDDNLQNNNIFDDIDNNNNNNENNDSLEKNDDNEINNDNTNVDIKNKYKTFKELRNAINNRNNNNNNIRKDNDKDNNNLIYEEYNKEKEEEINLETLFINREKYLKEIDYIKKGLQQK